MPASNPSAGAVFRLSLPCELGAVREAVAGARNFLADHRVRADDLTACELALVEACNNAILYAGESARQKPVEIEVMCHERSVELHVIDHTPGFEWPDKVELPEPDNEHGRGLFIVQSLMTETIYLRGARENRLIMRKARAAAGDDPSLAGANGLGDIQQKLALSEQVIGTMARELCVQIVTAREKQEELDRRLLAHELEIARNIQQSLLPRTFPALPQFGLGGFCLSARQVGGDFYDVLPLSEDSALLVVADVMGKGVPAALFAATLRTLLRTMAEWTQSPAELFSRMNRFLFDELSGVDMFITAQLAVVDVRQRRLVVASAGHCPLLLITGRGQIKAIAPEGMPLGILPHAQFTEEIVPLEKSSCALLYTDGLTEARNPHGDLFGQQRLEGWLRQGVQRLTSARALAADFLAELKRFQCGGSPIDDQTFLILAEEPPVRKPMPRPENAPAPMIIPSRGAAAAKRG